MHFDLNKYCQLTGVSVVLFVKRHKHDMYTYNKFNTDNINP